MDCISPTKLIYSKKIQNKQFKLPIQDSIKIIDQVKKIEKYNKAIRPDEDRKQYQQLVEWVNTKLQSTKQTIKTERQKIPKLETEMQILQQQTMEEQIQIKQRKIIQLLMQELVQMFKKQCKQKSYLMQICFEYFNRLINSYAKYYEKQFLQTVKHYNINLLQLQQQFGDRITQFNKKIATLESQKETKWKNVYMLAKDNRILRRQKGKLLRNIQEQQQKIKILQQQLCMIAKQNQLNKLIIRFENDSQNLKIFMKNRTALMKFEKIIEKYPKKAMKVLNNDLIKLQIQELNSLDSKIDYIRRVITESGDCFDEYEDLNQLIHKPNRIVFNMSCQTQPQDIQIPKQYKQIFTQYEIQHTSNLFEHWQQIYDFKIPGFPQLKQKYVCFRNPNKKLTNKVIKKKVVADNQKKQFFVMQICQRQIYQSINIKIRKTGSDFKSYPTAGVAFNPKLKNKYKLYFINSLDMQPDSIFNEQLNDNQGVDTLFRQTLPSKIRKYSNVQIKNLASLRKSQTQVSRGKYAMNKSNIHKFQNQKRSSQALSFQQSSDWNKQIQNQIIDQKSQLDSSVQSQQIQQIQTLQSMEEQNLLQKFKKVRKTTRRTITQSSTKGLQRQSTIPKLSSFAEQGKKHTQRMSVNIHEKVQNKSQRVNTQQSSKKRRTTKGPGNIGKMSRVKTTQNLRSSKDYEKNKMNMDFIHQQQNEHDDFYTLKLKQNEVPSNSRQSYRPPLNTYKNNKFYDTFNNLGIMKESHLNQIQGILAQRNKKYHLTVNPHNIANSNSLKNNPRNSSFNLGNSSFNIGKSKNRQSAINIDNASVVSHISSQKQSIFNYKKYLDQPKPQQSFESFEIQSLNPIFMKPFQVKKLAEKIIKSMYTRRKQLLLNPSATNLKGFIEHYLKQIYGNNWKGDKNLLRYAFTIDDRQTSSNLKVISLLLNVNVHIEYLQDLFRLYITMLQRNEYGGSQNPLITNKIKGAGIMKYLLSIYFDEETAKDIQQHLPFVNQYQIDLNQVFIAVEIQLRRSTVDTQIYQFLKQLIPENQSHIQFSQFKEIIYIFKNQQENYHSHIARLKYFFKTNGKNLTQQSVNSKTQKEKNGRNSSTDKANQTIVNSQKSAIQKEQTKQEPKGDIQILPIHRVCLYLKRYQWTNLIQINTFVQQKYHKVIGVFIQQETIKFVTKYCHTISQRSKIKKPIYQSGIMNISVPQIGAAQPCTVHPLNWLLERSKQMIRNYYRYKAPLNRYFLMFLHLSIITYEVQIGVNQVLSDSLGKLNLEYKKLKTKQQVDVFMKQ